MGPPPPAFAVLCGQAFLFIPWRLLCSKRHCHTSLRLLRLYIKKTELLPSLKKKRTLLENKQPPKEKKSWFQQKSNKTAESATARWSHQTPHYLVTCWLATPPCRVLSLFLSFSVTGTRAAVGIDRNTDRSMRVE